MEGTLTKELIFARRQGEILFRGSESPSISREIIFAFFVSLFHRMMCIVIKGIFGLSHRSSDTSYSIALGQVRHP